MNNQEPPDYSALIPEIADRNDGAAIDIGTWLSCNGGFPLAIAFSSLFWPRFVEFDSCVLFEDFSLSSFHGFMQQAKGNRAAVEGVMNHRHLLDLFPNQPKQPTAEQLDYLGAVLRDAWEAKLARDLPHLYGQ
jgi:hypothetical protein